MTHRTQQIIDARRALERAERRGLAGVADLHRAHLDAIAFVGWHGPNAPAWRTPDTPSGNAPHARRV